MGIAPMLFVLAFSAGGSGANSSESGTAGPAALAAPAPAQVPELRGATLIDSSVALVDQRVVTLSQLDQEARLAFVAHGAMDDASGPLDAAKRRAALDYLINQLLLDDEAARLQVFEITDQDSAAQQAILQSRFSSPAAFHAFLERFEITREVLDQSVRRGLRSERYLADRLTLIDSSLNAEARKNLAKQVESLLSEIRARHDVRVLTDFAAEASVSTGRPAAPLRAAADGGRVPTWGDVR